MHAFHIPLSINLWQLLYKDGEIIFSLLIELDVDKASTMKTEDDGEKNQTINISLLLPESEFLSLQWSQIHHTKLCKYLFFNNFITLFIPPQPY